jgi:hypothetical protein
MYKNTQDDRCGLDNALKHLVLHIVTLFATSVTYTIHFGTSVLK